jgi:hypothetical protein
MFKKDICEYVFPINTDRAAELKPKIDAALTAYKVEIQDLETKYLETLAKPDKTCGTSALSFTIGTLLLSIFVSKLL